MEAHAAAEPSSALPAGHTALVRREAPRVFLALVALTAVELAVARSGAGRAAVALALTGLAVTKAGLVGLFFMHLRHETRVLRWTVLGPLLAPGLYGLVLGADAAWRALR